MTTMRAKLRRGPADGRWLAAGLAVPAAGLVFWRLKELPGGEIGHLLLVYSFLPRLALSLICGASLALCGTIVQAVLRNPLAEPTTLGTSAGAQLALTIGALCWPSLPWAGREAAAVTGAATATMLSCVLAWRGGLSPLSLILAGLIVGLFCAAAAAILGLLHAEQLTDVFVWSTGSLAQYDWSGVAGLLPQFLVAAGLAGLLARPLTVVALDDDSARSLGVSLGTLRLAALGLAVALAASVVCVAGVIGFVGLGAPTIARAAGARSLRAQLLWSPVMGAALLCLTDQFVLAAGSHFAALPTGTATALLGAPLLLWLLPRLREGRPTPQQTLAATTPARRQWRRVGGLAVLVLLAILIALDAGYALNGWAAGLGSDALSLLPWRWPRVLGAAGAGGMLAAAGVLLQRLTGNPMASPEVLGVSSGAGLGVIILVFAVGAAGPGPQLAAAAAGSALVLSALLLLGRRSGFSPQRLLLAGIAATTVFSAIAALLMASGDPRMRMLLGWMSGSTYQVTGTQAIAGLIACGVSLAGMSLLFRLLAIVPLGGQTIRALGLSPAKARAALLLAASLATAAGTLLVGPLTFVGLMGPHLARLLGLRGAIPQLLGAAALGAVIMVLADWAARNLLYPYQIPAGLLASLVGGPFLLWSMRNVR